jgi:hypothetical protein
MPQSNRTTRLFDAERIALIKEQDEIEQRDKEGAVLRAEMARVEEAIKWIDLEARMHWMEIAPVGRQKRWGGYHYKLCRCDKHKDEGE